MNSSSITSWDYNKKQAVKVWHTMFFNFFPDHLFPVGAIYN